MTAGSSPCTQSSVADPLGHPGAAIVPSSRLGGAKNRLGASSFRDRMVDVLAVPVLVLNRYFQPVQMTTARRAMVLVYGGAARRPSTSAVSSTISTTGAPCRPAPRTTAFRS